MIFSYRSIWVIVLVIALSNLQYTMENILRLSCVHRLHPLDICPVIIRSGTCVKSAKGMSTSSMLVRKLDCGFRLCSFHGIRVLLGSMEHLPVHLCVSPRQLAYEGAFANIVIMVRRTGRHLRCCESRQNINTKEESCAGCQRHCFCHCQGLSNHDFFTVCQAWSGCSKFRRRAMHNSH